MSTRLLREVRQIGLRGGALHVDFGGERAQRINRAARVTDRFFLALGRLLDLHGALVGAYHVLSQALELRDVLVHQTLPVDDRLQQALALIAHQRDIAGA